MSTRTRLTLTDWLVIAFVAAVTWGAGATGWYQPVLGMSSTVSMLLCGVVGFVGAWAMVIAGMIIVMMVQGR